MHTEDYAERYAGMTDRELATVASGGPLSLTDEAKLALQNAVSKRGLTLTLHKQHPAHRHVRKELKHVFFKEWGTLLVLPAILALVFLSFIYLINTPFEVYAPLLIGYTGLVFLLLFCDTRGMKGYSLGEQSVRAKIPLLVAIHAAFLVFVSLTLATALWSRPYLPNSWFVEQGSRRMTVFSFLLIWIFVLLGSTQVWISRRILRRSVESN